MEKKLDSNLAQSAYKHMLALFVVLLVSAFVNILFIGNYVLERTLPAGCLAFVTDLSTKFVLLW